MRQITALALVALISCTSAPVETASECSCSVDREATNRTGDTVVCAPAAHHAHGVIGERCVWWPVENLLCGGGAGSGN